MTGRTIVQHIDLAQEFHDQDRKPVPHSQASQADMALEMARRRKASEFPPEASVVPPEGRQPTAIYQ